MSRRSMIKVLSMEENSTVVFTTHSMNEAQAICTKIAILIKGNLRELRTLKQLKDKYYASYFVDIFYNQSYMKVADALRLSIGQFDERLVEEGEKKIKIEVKK
jgi:ABC-type multidrug transport system ATPase subunit